MDFGPGDLEGGGVFEAYESSTTGLQGRARFPGVETYLELFEPLGLAACARDERGAAPLSTVASRLGPDDGSIVQREVDGLTGGVGASTGLWRSRIARRRSRRSRSEAARRLRSDCLVSS